MCRTHVSRRYRLYGDFDFASGLNSILTVGHDLLARLQPIVNDCGSLSECADLNRPLLHGAVFADDKGVRSVGTLLHRSHRYRDHIAAGRKLDTEVDKLPGPQDGITVVEFRLIVYCARGRIELIVDDGEHPSGESLPIAIERRYNDIAIVRPSAELRQRVSGKREAYEDRVDLIDGDDARRIACPHDVACIDQACSNPAVYRRTNAAVV